jgi:hypothetical protein
MTLARLACFRALVRTMRDISDCVAMVISHNLIKAASKAPRSRRVLVGGRGSSPAARGARAVACGLDPAAGAQHALMPARHKPIKFPLDTNTVSTATLAVLSKSAAPWPKQLIVEGDLKMKRPSQLARDRVVRSSPQNLWIDLWVTKAHVMDQISFRFCTFFGILNVSELEAC